MTSLKHLHKNRPLAKLLQAFWLLAWLISGEGVASAICMFLAERNDLHEVMVHHLEDGSAIYVLSHGDGTIDTATSIHPKETKLERPRTVPEQHHLLSPTNLNNHHRRHGRCLSQILPTVAFMRAIEFYSFFEAFPGARNAIRQIHSTVHSSGLKVRQSRKVMRC
jgi:hypothetical protein